MGGSSYIPSRILRLDAGAAHTGSLGRANATQLDIVHWNLFTEKIHIH
jgi:hypothetical protein